MNSPLSIFTVRHHFKRIADGYDQFAFLQHEVADRLLSRLDFIKLKPETILDCGARTAYTTNKLNQRYPHANIIALDISEALLQQNVTQDYAKLCADYERLPVTDHSIDLVFSHFALHWAEDLPQMIREWHRVLRPNGLLLFSTLGPDTLLQLRATSQTLGQPPRLHDFRDMHDIGDLLLQQRFVDPVMDRECLDLHYKCVNNLFDDLKYTGVSNARCDRPRGLQGKQAWQQFLEAYQQNWQLPDGQLAATFELVYGHAFMPQQFADSISSLGEVKIPVSALTGKPS